MTEKIHSAYKMFISDKKVFLFMASQHFSFTIIMMMSII